MKFALALLLLATPVFAADAPSSKGEKEIIATLATWKEAMLKGDAATLGKLYHPDLLYTHSSAKRENKTEAITNATAPGAVTKNIELHSPIIHVYGNMATVKSLGDFTPATGAVVHLDLLMVFLKTSSGWQLVARQATKLP
ncbi:MAG: nuclear transport factor 2 family protein [Terriglobia bacterium]